MQHYASFHDQGLNDRPWAPWFGEPSLVVSTEALVHTLAESGETYLPGAWGYVCPTLEDTTTGDIIEYCFQEWRGSHNQEPLWREERAGSSAECNSWAGHRFGMVITLFYSGTHYATQVAGTANTFVWPTSGWFHFEALITPANLKAAIEAVNASCGHSSSTNPADWAVIGAENGMEGWRELAILGGADGKLSLRTTYNPLPPVASTEGATAPSEANIIAKGSVNANGISTNYHFDYGETTAYGSSTTSQYAGSSVSPVPVTGDLYPLKAGTIYHYRLVAESSAGISYGGDRTMLSLGPTVSTTPASAIQEEQATLNANINPNGSDTHYFFEYGTTTSYGNHVPYGTEHYDAGSGTSTVPVSATATALTPNTTYHYRVFAESADGVAEAGEDKTFTTLPNYREQCAGANIVGQGDELLHSVWGPAFNISTDKYACSGTQGSKTIPTVTFTETGTIAGLESWGLKGHAASYGISNAFIGTEEPPGPAEKEEIEAHEGTLMPETVETVPVLQTAVAVVAHLPAGCVATSSPAKGRLVLNNATLEGIFRGTINKWNEITEGGDKLSGSGCNSATSITRVVRRDQAGTTHIFKRYLGLINGSVIETEAGLNKTWNAMSEGTENTVWPRAAAVVRPSGNGGAALLKKVSETPGSIGYADLSDARANSAFVPPSGGAEKSTFWVMIQKSIGETITYGDPSTNKDVATVGEADCGSEEYSNGELPFPPSEVESSWNEVTTKTIESKYTICGFVYDLAFDRYSAYLGTEAREATAVRNFLRFVVDSAKETEGNGNNGGQILAKTHDYLALPSVVRTEMQGSYGVSDTQF
jgi:ABC-type phosphate transport system substrate-binding protein